MYMPQVRFIIGMLIILSIFSCQREDPDTTKILSTAEQITEQYPDSALILLDSVANHYNLNTKQFNKYQLLYVQAKNKAYKDISSDTLLFQVKNYYVNNNDIENSALAAFYCGRILQEQGKEKAAMAEYLIAEEYIEKTNNNNLKGLVQSSIGSVFQKQFLEVKAIEHFLESARYFYLANNKRNEIISYNLIGNTYLMKSLNDSAFYYYRIGLKLAKESNDSLQLANITQCIGIAYRQIGNYGFANNYFRQATQYTTDNDYKSKLYLNMAKIFCERNMSDSVKSCVDKSLSFIQQGGDSTSILTSVYKILSQMAEKQYDFKQSLYYHKKYTDKLVEIVDENKNKEILELQKKYKYRHFQNENKQMKVERQKIYLLFTTLLLAACLIVMLFHRKSIRSEKIALERENEILDAKRKIYQLIEMSNSYEDKENSFRNMLLHHFDILKKVALLRQYISGEDEQVHRLAKKVNEIVYGQESLNWDMLLLTMNELHDGLFNRLKEKFPSLDEAEFRIYCLTYKKFCSSEIALIMNLSVNTVQMKRSSIRRKIGIEAMGNINEFLDNLS